MARLFLIPLLAFAVFAHADTLPEGKTLHLYTTDGRWKVGKWRAVEGDSVVLESGRRETRLARGDIARAWVRRRDPARHALGSGVTGAIGGAFVELTLGGVDAGDVLRSAGIGAGFGLAGGALSSLLFGNDAWNQVVPAPTDGHGEKPFPDWAATVRGGIARSSISGAGTDPHFGLTLWAFDSPSVTVGAEYGALTRASSTVRAIVPSGPALQTIEVRSRDRLAFATTQIRWRFARTGLRPQGTLGMGEYLFRRIVDESVQDSTGAFQPVSSDRRTDSRFGVNVGLGFGQQGGDLRPGVEVRAHWPFNAGATYYTLAAILDFR